MKDVFTLRYMTLDDLSQVAEVDRLSFSIPWSVRTYEYEIAKNENSQMMVVTLPNATLPSPNGRRPLTGVWGWLNRLTGAAARQQGEAVVGLGGLWCAVGEAHISTIAVHPDWRGRSLGELLLSGMLVRGIALGAMEAVLEVRVSNEVAQNLYFKYGFEVVTRRPHYYHDNNEDAYIMAVTKLDRVYQARLARLRRELAWRLRFVDRVNGAP